MSAILRVFSDFSQSPNFSATAFIVADHDLVIVSGAEKISHPPSTLAGELTAILFALKEIADGSRVQVHSDVDHIRDVMSGLGTSAGIDGLRISIAAESKRFKSIEYAYLPHHKRGVFYHICHWAAKTLSTGDKLKGHRGCGTRNVDFHRHGARTLLGPLLNEALAKK